MQNERMLKWFEFAHLPPHLQEVLGHSESLPKGLREVCESGPERTVALRKLLEARTRLAARSCILGAKTNDHFPSSIMLLTGDGREDVVEFTRCVHCGAHIPFKASIEGIVSGLCGWATVPSATASTASSARLASPSSSSSTTSRLAVIGSPRDRFRFSFPGANSWRQRQRPRQREATRLPRATRGQAPATSRPTMLSSPSARSRGRRVRLPARSVVRFSIPSGATIDGIEVLLQTLRNGDVKISSFACLDDARTQLGDNKANVGVVLARHVDAHELHGGSPTTGQLGSLGTR